MGNRTKLVYKCGILKKAVTGEILKKWNVVKERIVPPCYSVCLTLSDGNLITIQEDEKAVWISDEKNKIAVSGTESGLKLPDFKQYKYPNLGWACDNFHGIKTSPISNRDYPLTWEIGASEAE